MKRNGARRTSASICQPGRVEDTPPIIVVTESTFAFIKARTRPMRYAAGIPNAISPRQHVHVQGGPLPITSHLGKSRFCPFELIVFRRELERFPRIVVEITYKRSSTFPSRQESSERSMISLCVCQLAGSWVSDWCMRSTKSLTAFEGASIAMGSASTRSMPTPRVFAAYHGRQCWLIGFSVRIEAGRVCSPRCFEDI